MAFFTSAVGTLQTLVIALGAGLGIWGAINLMEGYGNDNPGAKSQGMKHLIGDKTAYGRRRCSPYRYHTCAVAFRSFLRASVAGSRRKTTEYG